VWHHYGGVHAGSLNAPAESSAHAYGMPPLRIEARKDPPLGVLCHLAFSGEDFGDAPRQGLPAPSTALDLNAQPPSVRVEILETRAEQLGMAQGCGQSKLDKKPYIRVAVAHCGSQQRLFFIL
jgi:hypothetical protein